MHKDSTKNCMQKPHNCQWNRGPMHCFTSSSLSNRLEDLTTVFSRPVYELSYIFNDVLNIIYDEHSHLLLDLDQPWLSHPNLDIFSDAISDRGSPLMSCWGFIDGTIRPICRPVSNQKLLFSGHKRTHGIKFQSITTPNGLIANLYGPVEGCRHDAGMLRLSGIMGQLQDKNDKARWYRILVVRRPCISAPTSINRPI